MIKNNRKKLLLLAIVQFFSLSLWFDLNAIISQITIYLSINSIQISFLSIISLYGFIFGGIIFSIFNIPDKIKSENIFIISSFLGAIFNSLLTIIPPNYYFFLIIRFIIGFFLAGIYPLGMKLTTTWFKKERGFALSILLASLSLGSGLPYLFNIIPNPNWKLILNFSSILGLISSILVFIFIKEGPYKEKKIKFNLKNIKTIIKNKKNILISIGYFGHMWELYAMWIYLPLMLKSSYELFYPGKNSLLFFSISSFSIFLIGAIGTFYGGKIANKIGSIKFNIIVLIMSGFSTLIVGFTYFNPYLLLFISLIWGITIIPDSPQFSSLLSHFTKKELIGTSLTLQTSIGFFISTISIYLIGILLPILTWTWIFTILTIGPIISLISLFKLKKLNN